MADYLSPSTHLRTRAAAQSSADGGKGKAPLINSLIEALTGRKDRVASFPEMVRAVRDGSNRVVTFEDAGWELVVLKEVPKTPTDVAKLIDAMGIHYILNQWTLVGIGREHGVKGKIPTQEKGNLIVVGPTTRSLLEVGVPTDRSSFSSGFGEQYGAIYDSDGTIKLQPETLKVYQHPELSYRVATIDGYVVPTDDPRNERVVVEGTYRWEKPFQPLVPVDASREKAVEKVIEVLKERGTKEIIVLISNKTGDLKEVRWNVSNGAQRAEFEKALQGQAVAPVGKEVAQFLITSNPDAPYFAAPDPYTLMVDPFNPKRMMLLGEVLTEDGKPFENDTRYRMREFLQNLWEGYGQIPVVGLEPEWFLITRNVAGNPIPTDFNLYYDRFQDHPKEVQDILLTALGAMAQVGIQITNTTSEVAGSQHEWVVEAKFPPKEIEPESLKEKLPYQYLSALRTLDDFMLYKYLLKRTAALHGKEVSFEAKPFKGVNGSGMHTHLSIWQAHQDGTLTNLFSDPEKIVELSKVGQSAAEGIMLFGREMFAFTNQNAADMFRHIAGFEAPIYTGFFSEENRSSPIRRPKTTSASGARFEYRVPAPDDNMYLNTGVILSAALFGMVNQLEMRKPIVGKNIYKMSAEELLEHLPKGLSGIDAQVPSNFEEAIAIASTSLNSGRVRELLKTRFLTENLATTFLSDRRQQLAKAVREPYPFPAETVAHDGGAKVTSLTKDEIASLLLTQLPVRKAPKIGTTGAVLISETLLAADASLVERLKTWPKNVPLILVSHSGKWREILGRINSFSRGAQTLSPEIFATVITPETKGIVNMNDVQNVAEIAELETRAKIAAYAVEENLRAEYQLAFQGAYGIIYRLPEKGSKQVTIGINAFNDLLNYLALPKADQEKILAALNGIKIVEPIEAASKLEQYFLEYDQTVRGF